MTLAELSKASGVDDSKIDWSEYKLGIRSNNRNAMGNYMYITGDTFNDILNAIDNNKNYSPAGEVSAYAVRIVKMTGSYNKGYVPRIMFPYIYVEYYNNIYHYDTSSINEAMAISIEQDGDNLSK